ncbi:Coenzyme PQQ synthesis protein D (PqqD) [Paenibacillus sp. CF095]|uniref:PqqD family protein n=1 Tax=Paenibacillus sp. CF095 TaxID=1881033 RepID=UPI00088BA8FB|nr:PqqD family protein [Paenibacillus sp. CF095]SDD55535.1 Coenzyme PQQ synthesis protein D (PqqD) [Paenibacillus sp. CF095]
MNYTIDSNVIYVEMDGQSILLNMESSQYYALDQVGTFIWNLMKDGRTLNEMEQEILLAYDITEQQVKNDLKIYIDELCRVGIIKDQN